MTTAVHERLRVTDPARWRELALSWRRWATLAGRLAAEVGLRVAALGEVWRGAAATAAARRLDESRRRLTLFRLHCWVADQVTSEFAATLTRARALLTRALAAGAPGRDDNGDFSAALLVAARADAEATVRLERLTRAIEVPARPPGPGRPDCATSPAGVRRWWDGLAAEERAWLLTTEAVWLARLDGLPVADRDVANRLLLDDRRAEIDRAVAGATGRERDRLRDVRDGLARLSDRLADENGPRAYLLSLDTGAEGRAVVALGDPDRSDKVLTHVPGMTADLASFGGELARAERVAVRAAELTPRSATSAILWLDYDAPDFVDEAASARRAEAAAPALRQFQEGLRAGHEGPPARQVVLGHSYGSLVVGQAAATGFEADGVVFVGSPGVGVDSARELRVPPGDVWSSTSRGDVIQYAAVAPGGLVRDLVTAGSVPVAGPWLAFGRPERDLWFGHNPSDPAFGARVFASAPGGGHVGYWDNGSPSLDTLAAITTGAAR
ncbi:alpha/beta hydrolase [Actinoplanes sp. M2I2]|uniref:alpha/beta hydrolase n=1 Tax=Actinoplanes sp. M2I2 TaxID=1734444 RepID=UPI0020203D59|nr:alpha/beta hydrolase [Actinoplanes sp. M2I2]